MAFNEKRKVPALCGVSPIYKRVDVEKTDPITGEVVHVKDWQSIDSDVSFHADECQLIEQLNSGMRVKKVDSKIDSNDRIDLPDELFTKPAETTAPY